ncbi:MAG: nitroreductase family protein [Bacteroidia bacterium]|nr:nitroreductase family protein [Bacteroidia bacterium]
MADNYLEKRYDEVFGKGSKAVVRKTNPSLETLLLRNRSHRAYDQSYEVMRLQLEAIVRANTLTASARNQQVLRFKLLTKQDGADLLKGKYALGGALPELHLPAPGTEPEAFIVICSTVPENRYVDIDLGISCEAMSLKAVELGLNAIVICNFNKEAVQAALDLPYTPLAVLAVGKGMDKIKIVEIGEAEDHNYYRQDGIHCVPKVRLDELILD